MVSVQQKGVQCILEDTGQGSLPGGVNIGFTVKVAFEWVWKGKNSVGKEHRLRHAEVLPGAKATDTAEHRAGSDSEMVTVAGAQTTCGAGEEGMMGDEMEK